MKYPFVLVDGSSYLFRAYHALPPLTNSKGHPTGAIYGVINMLRKLVKEYKPKYIAVVMDAPGKNFRHELYEDYKANRTVMPDELRVQIEPLKKIITAMGLPLIILPGVEADDVIGTLAQHATHQKMDTLISTGDKDLAQLVNKHITLVNTMTDVILDEAGVVNKFGVKPAQIIDYLSLIGDTSDNIPGIPKVGPKTAEKWLKEYNDIKTLRKNADKITGKIGEVFREHQDILPLMQELVTIKLDLPLEIALDDLIQAEADTETLHELFHEMEFKRWLEELGKVESPASTPKPTAEKAPTPAKPAHYETVLTQEQFDHWMAKLEKASLFAVDTETTSLDFNEARMVGVSVAITTNEAAYFPFGHTYPGAPTQLPEQEILGRLKPILENPRYLKIGHNLKYDMNVLLNHGIELKGIAFDTMLESYVTNSTANLHNMDTLAEKLLGHKTITFADIAGKGAKQKTFDQIELEQAGPYSAEDAEVTLRLHHWQWPRLVKEKGLAYIFREIEMALLPVLAKMERTGVLIDAPELARQSSVLEKRIDELAKSIFEQAGQEFNIDSPKQLQVILFEKMKLPVLAKTPTGQASTAEGVLQELADDFELPKHIIEYRQLRKLKTTYTDSLPQQISAKTGRVHTSFQQAVTATGRLSSTEPNLQNIPIRTVEGRQIRRAFIAPPKHQIISADYSQIELRIMAHLANDQNLINAFAKGLDIHSATAAEVWGVAIDKVTSEQRRKAKAINFGLIYGMSSVGLAKQIDVSRHEAQEYIDIYFDRYPGVKKYMESARHVAVEQGYVETIFGRRLYLPEINSSNRSIRNAAERAAINAPMQGTAADIIKLAMIGVDKWLQETALPVRMILQVHDELVLEVPDELVEQVKQKLPEIMAQAAQLKVPLVANVGVGKNWEEAH
jgi:DNA polymerase-1